MKITEQPFLKFDIGFTMGFGVEWKLNDRISIPLAVCVDQGVRDIKNRRSQVIDTTTSPTRLINYWGTTEGNYSTKFYNTTFGIRIGIRINIWSLTRPSQNDAKLESSPYKQELLHNRYRFR